MVAALPELYKTMVKLASYFSVLCCEHARSMRVAMLNPCLAMLNYAQFRLAWIGG
jgi:hypothetical protein